MSDNIDHSREADLQALAQRALAHAKALGASGAEVSVGMDDGLSVKARRGTVETIAEHCDKVFSITFYRGKAKGGATTSDFSVSAIEETVRAAGGIAKHTTEDEYAGLAEAELMADTLPDLDLYHPWAVNADQAADLALACEAAALDVDTRISRDSDGASVSTSKGIGIYANSHGFMGTHQGTRHGISCSVMAVDKDQKQRDHWYGSHRLAQQLESPEEVGKKAAQRALRRLDARRLKTGHYPVIYEAGLSQGLVSSLLSAISGGVLYRKSSFLVDHLGQTIFPENIQVHENPLIPRGVGSAAFDGDGLARRAQHFIRDGQLVSYSLGSYSARKLGMASTANAGGVRNIMLDSTTREDLSGLLQVMGTGVLITEMMGSGVNLMTGDYSRGAAGFWVEDGQLAYPIEEFTVAGNLRDMFKQLIAVGSDIDRRGNIACGSILLDKMMLASGD